MAVKELGDLVTLSPGAAAAHLGVTEGTLANWRWSGQGPAFVKVGRTVRYRADDIRSFLQSQTRRSTSDRGAEE